MFNLTVDEFISLRSFQPDHAEAFFRLLEQNRARLRPWISPTSLYETAKATRIFTIECLFDDLEDSMETLALFKQYYPELDGYFLSPRPAWEFGIWFHENLVGFISISHLSDSKTAAKFGYWLTLEQEGKGIMTRCVSALMDWAIEKMKIQRFVITCAVSNQRSRSIAERLGYRLQVTQPGREVVGEFIYDRVIYGIRSTTWLERNQVNGPGI